MTPHSVGEEIEELVEARQERSRAERHVQSHEDVVRRSIVTSASCGVKGAQSKRVTRGSFATKQVAEDSNRRELISETSW
jgi:hypothetical protein